MSDNPCIFFTHDMIVVNDKNPLLDYNKTVERLKLTVHDILNNESIGFIHCEIGISDQELQQSGYQCILIKRFLPEVDTTIHKQILRGYHWINWEKQSKYCGRCSKALTQQDHPTEKKCLACNISYFPRFSPAVMVLIQHEDKILLARSPHFPNGFYSAIAGFIDIGETAEEAAHREVKEELGIEITDLEYFGTQDWPFPDSFMIAFRAKYLRGELQIDNKEIVDAQWFSSENLPHLPSSVSISKRLIESTIEKIISTKDSTSGTL